MIFPTIVGKLEAAVMETEKYTLDIGDQRLWKGDEPVSITNKAFQLLKLFVDSPKRLLSKEQILDTIWGEVYVTEGLIREYVHDLRTALEDDPKKPRFIETVPRHGYRFLGGVEIRGENRLQENADRTGDGRPLLEVRLFEDLSQTSRSKRLAHGLTDDLITQLAKFPDLAVVSASDNARGTALSGSEARYRLEGGVQISGSALRLNARLLKTDEIRHIWSACYDRELEDLLTVQSELTAQIGSMIGGMCGPLSHSERSRLRRCEPSDLETYELYRLAFDLELDFDRDSVLRARGLIERAIEIDPEFSRGWLVLGWICWQLAMEKWEADRETFRQRMCHAYLKAAYLDPRDQMAIMESAAAKAVQGDLHGASDALERSLDLGGRHADTLISCSNYVASILDDPGRALSILDSALSILPELSAFHHLSILRVAFFAGDYRRAVDAAPLSPDLLPARVFHALALSELGEKEKAQAAALKVLDRTPEFGAAEYLLDHPIVGAAVSDQFLAACDRLGLPQV